MKAMRGVYKIPLSHDEEPNQNARVKAILAALAIGAQYDMRVVDAPLMVDTERGKRPVEIRDGNRGCQTVTRYVEIRARGGKERPRRVTPVTPCGQYKKPAAPDLAKCQREYGKALEALESVRAGLPVRIRNQWKPEPQDWDAPRYDGEIESRNEAIGAAVGRVIARHGGNRTPKPNAEDYTDLDNAIGGKVPRLSKVTEHNRNRHGGYLGWIVWSYGRTFRGYCSTNWDRGERTERMERKRIEEAGHRDSRQNTNREACQDTDRDTAIMSCLCVRLECEYWGEMARLADERESACVPRL